MSHRRWVQAGLVLAICVPLLAQAAIGREPLALNGQPLTSAQILDVARDGRRVEITAAAHARVASAFQIVLAAARARQPVYGLTTGVGWNKDKKVLGPTKEGGVSPNAEPPPLDPELLAASHRFNIGTLRAHAAGIGAPLPDEVVRAAMLLRLNLLLTGDGGVQPALVEQYAAFLNAGITPVVPARGSVGEADIALTSHIGLALAGEWRVRRGGVDMPAAKALRAAGLHPVELVGKDFLSIIGDNTLTAADALFSVQALRSWLDDEITVFALSLEGLNGNVAPFLDVVVAAHPEPGFAAVAQRLRATLQGSDLWKPSEGRALQDPLSFRTMPIVLGNVWDALDAAERETLFTASHSGDNPVVLTDAGSLASEGDQARRYLVPGVANAAIVPTANFEALPLVAALERLSIALGHASESITASVLRFENPALTGLPRFLTAPGNPGHGFGVVQKTVAALNFDIRALATPVSLESATLAGNIEDITNSGPLTARRLGDMIDDLYQLTSLQLLHAAQAVDLRPGFHLGAGTHPLLSGYRAHVPFAPQDRILTDDIQAGVQYLRGLPRAAPSDATPRQGAPHE